MTELERWHRVAARTGLLLVKWFDKHPMVRAFAPTLRMVGLALQELSIEKIEALLDEAEK